MSKNTASAPPTLNLLAGLPSAGAEETVEMLLKGDGVRVERIVSHGQASPDGFWYDQDEAEWVLLLSGRARLTIEGEAEDRALGPGDSVFLPAHCRHRVAWTDPDAPTVWLTIFVDARPDLKAGFCNGPR
jgi:cupin 2 domain-containing protein